MNRHDQGLWLRTSPHDRAATDTPRIMRDVLLALTPVSLAALLYFGVAAVLVVGGAVAGCVATEAAFAPRGRRTASLRDGSALLTGLLLGLTLPPSFPVWMAFLGGVVAIGLGKVVWGGLGHNLFNPALVGRAFLQAAFPTAITTWSPQRAQDLAVYASNLAMPFMKAPVDAISTATPLGLMKFQGQGTDLWSLLVGDCPGSLGETSAVLLLVGGVYLWRRRALDWRIPAAILGTVFVFSGLVWLVAAKAPPPWFMLGSGGLMLGALFMATDPVTSPMAPLGAWIYGAGIGVLVVLIRLWGGLPEGVMYAILLMNAVTPLINRGIQPTPFGRGRKAPREESP
ncbi:MAG: RnfABCDGE type electron transport complex subunit D [Pseudomonadota bacterium]